MQYLKSNDCDLNNSIKYSKQAQTLESQHTDWGLTLSIQPALVTDGEGFCTQLNKVIASSMTSESQPISTASSHHSHLTFYSTVFLLSLKPHSSIIDTIHFFLWGVWDSSQHYTRFHIGTIYCVFWWQMFSCSFSSHSASHRTLTNVLH